MTISLQGGPKFALVTWSLLGFASTVFLWSLLVGDFHNRPKISNHRIPNAEFIEPRVWPGFGAIKDLVVFGDALSTTYFLPEGQRPSFQEPFGNQDALFGKIRADGLKWVEYLQSEYNQSCFKVTNLAEVNATIEHDAYEPRPQGIAPSLSTNSLKEAVSLFQGEKYGNQEPFNDWNGNNTIFVTWYGADEIVRSLQKRIQIPFEAVFAAYSSSFDRLYRLGARNFLIINVPPIDIVLNQNYARQIDLADQIREFNGRLINMHHKLLRRHHGATYFFYNVHKLWTQVVQKPESFRMTMSLKNVTGYCEYYATQSTDPNDIHEGCKDGRAEYFWLDNKRPTHAVQRLTAAVMAQDCFGIPQTRTYCTDGSW